MVRREKPTGEKERKKREERKTDWEREEKESEREKRERGRKQGERERQREGGSPGSVTVRYQPMPDPGTQNDRMVTIHDQCGHDISQGQGAILAALGHARGRNVMH